MSFEGNVSTTVVSGAQAVDRVVLNIPLHLSSSPTFPQRVRTYASPTDAAADTLLGTEGKAAVDLHFAQELHAPTIKIGRVADTPAAMVVTFTVAGTPLENEVYRVVINDIVIEHVAGAAPTVSSVHTALDTAITTALADEELTISGVDPDVICTADNAGEQFSHLAEVDDPPGGTATGTLEAVLTTPNAGIGSDLDACLVEDDGWYGLTTEIDGTPADNLVIMQAASAWCQINKKIYLGQSDDADVLTAVADNDLEKLAKKNNSRTAYAWHHADAELLAVGAMGYKFQADPDVQSTNWAYVPVSSVSLKGPPRLTPTEYGNIKSQHGNYFGMFGGRTIGKFSMGITTTGKHIDTIITEDWLRARLTEAYIQTLSDAGAANRKIGLNDKALQIFPNNGQKILDQGVAAEHLNEGTTSISVQKRADMSDADVLARHVRVTASGVATGSAELVTVTMTLSLA